MTAAENETRHIRLRGDLAMMISAIAWYERTTTAELADPLLRSAIEKRFAKLPSDAKTRAMAPRK
jgi:hypothetical protein